MLKFVKDEEEYNLLSDIVHSEEKFRKFEEQNNNIVDVLKKFESIQMKFIDFYNLVPKISVSDVFIN